MSTLLRDAKNYYNNLFERDVWSDELADNLLIWLDDKNKRKECLKETYKLILDSSDVSEAVKTYIRQRYSICDTAIKCKTSSDSIRNHCYYINKTLGKDLTFDKENIIKICIERQDITRSDWEAINKILQAAINKRKSKELNIGKLLDNRSMLINIPRKEYKTEIDETEFNLFIRLIQPYFINERKRVQQEINENHLDAAGYLNYIMTPGIELNSTDQRRLAKVKSLLDDRILKDYKKLNKDKITNLLGIEEEQKPVQAEEKNMNVQDLYIKTHRVQFDL